MRSIDTHEQRDVSDDRTTKARIRDAAIQSIATNGVADTTARRVADAAAVSPGSVIHHFGSMQGLRAACDDYVAAAIRHLKMGAMDQGPQIDIVTSLRSARLGPILGYLANVLTDDSPAVAVLVDELVADAEEYLQHGIEKGMLAPCEDLRRRAAIMTLWNLGALVLHHHVARLMDVDLTDPLLTESPDFAAYGRAVYEIYGGGVLTDEFAANALDAMRTLASTDASPPPPTPETIGKTRD